MLRNYIFAALNLIMVALCTALAVSCSRETIRDVAVDDGQTEASVTFSLSVPGGDSAMTRGMSADDEKAVSDVEVLLFRNAGGDRVFYKTLTGLITTKPGENPVFTVTIPIDEYDNFDIDVIANAGAEVAAAGFVVGEPKQTALNRLSMSLAAGSKWTGAIPMWGEKLDVTVTNGLSMSGADAMVMVRMLARIDVELSPRAASGSDTGTGNDNFALTSVRLYNYSTTGMTVPDLAAWDYATNKATAPHAPAGGFGKTGIIPLIYTAADEEASAANMPDGLTQAVYTFESPKGNAQDVAFNTCVIIGGHYWGAADETFYRIEIADKDAVTNTFTYKDILRNHRYLLHVTAISGPGMDAPGDALASPPVNIEVDVVEWNMEDIEIPRIGSNGNLSVKPTAVQLTETAKPSKESNNIVTVTSDHPYCTAEVWDDAAGAGKSASAWLRLTADPTGAGASDKITVGRTTSKGREIYLIATANDTPLGRTAYVVATAGSGTRNVVTVTQSAASSVSVSDAAGGAVTALNFASGAGAPVVQKITVRWSPADKPLKITKSNSDFRWTTDYDKTEVTGGSYTFTIDPPNLTTAFDSKTSDITFSVTGAGGTTDSRTVKLTNTNYTILAEDFTTTGIVGGGTFTGKIKANTAWKCTVTRNLTSGTCTVPTTEGAGNTSGENFTYTLSADANGSVKFTFATNDATKPAASKDITVNTASPTLSANPTKFDLTYAAATGKSATVTTNVAAGWTATKSDTWITLTKDTGKSGEAVTFSVAENPYSTQRSGTITLSATGANNVTITVNQAGAAATLSVTPTSYAFAVGGEAKAFTVTTNVQAGWSYGTLPSWITATKSGNTLTLTAAAAINTARSATITLSATGASDATISVSQAAATLSVTPTSHAFAIGGEAKAFTVTTNVPSGWNYSGVPSWITATKSGNTLTLTAAQNTSTTARANATITLSATGANNATISVSQAGATLTVSSTTLTVGNAAGTNNSISVSINNGQTLSVTAKPSWITAASISGGKLSLTYNAQTVAESRNGTVTVGSSTITKDITVTQNAAAATLSVSPTSYQWEASGGAKAFTVTTNVPAGWNYSGVPSWLTASKSGNTLTLTASANSGAARTAVTVTITATGATNASISVSQKAVQIASGTWAYSNVYRQSGQLKFNTASGQQYEKGQGMLFKWGSLIGLNPSSSYPTWNQQMFIPTEYTGGTPSSYANIPYDTGTAVLSSYNAAAGTGDICRYITAKGWVSGRWRMPTTTELQNLYNAGSSKVGSFGAQSATDYDGWTDITSGYNFGSGSNQRFFPAAGSRTTDGTLNYVGTSGYYWSASPYNSSSAYSLYFYSTYVGPATSNDKQLAFSVRCIAE